MSQNNTVILYVGLDVAKLSLELHLAGKTYALANHLKGHEQLLKRLRPYPAAQVICEATGGYEQAVVHSLQSAGIPVSIIEAGRVRHFARAQGQRAKTDPIDAAVLAAYGQACHPAPTPPASPQQQQLSQLVQRRRQLVQLLLQERNHAEHYTDPFRIKQFKQLAKLLEKQIAQCEAAILTLIAQDAQLDQKAK